MVESEIRPLEGGNYLSKLVICCACWSEISYKILLFINFLKGYFVLVFFSIGHFCKFTNDLWEKLLKKTIAIGKNNLIHLTKTTHN